jgi:hypothetical protein
VVSGYIEVHANGIHPICLGVYPHIGHEHNVQTSGVVGVRVYVT